MTSDTNTISISEAALPAVAGQLDGRVICPDEPGFVEATLIWDGMTDKHLARLSGRHR